MEGLPLNCRTRGGPAVPGTPHHSWHLSRYPDPSLQALGATLGCSEQTHQLPTSPLPALAANKPPCFPFMMAVCLSCNPGCLSSCPRMGPSPGSPESPCPWPGQR